MVDRAPRRDPDLRPAGDACWLLVERDEPSRLAAYAAFGQLARARDVVLGAESVLVVGDAAEGLTRAEVAGALDGAGRTGVAGGRTVEVPTVYDGEDLALVAERAGLTRDDVIARHLAATFTVAFIGFQPGFAYLSGLPPELATPRRASPRPRVRGGSVGIGASWCGIYPAETPGGWNLVGSTRVRLFDAAADPPALLAAGDRVRFVRA